MDGFAHLHVASGFSMRYGASMPEHLVERAAEHGQGALALTDRDGLYGAVRFATACGRAGIAPVLGVDLAVEPIAFGAVGGATGTTASGRVRLGQPGRAVRARAPGRMPAARVRARAPRCAGVRSSTPGGPGSPCSPGAGAAAPPRASAGRRCAGWSPRPTCAASGACRSPAPTCSPPGPTPPTATSCDLGTVLAARRPPKPQARSHGVERRSASRAGCSCCSAPTPTSAGRCSPGGASGPATCSRPGRRCCPRDGLAVEVVHHGGPEGTPGCRSHAAHLLALADAAGLPAVLTAAVRHADPEQVRTVDLLDAARRLVVLDSRHLDRVTDAGHLASTAAMHASALEVTGGDRSRADRLVAMTVPGRRRVHPAGPPRPRHRRGAPARGRGARHRPRHRPDAGARAALPRRGRPALPRGDRGRAAGRARPARRRARGHRHPGLPHLLPHRRRGHRPDPGPRGAGRGPRLGRRQPGQPPARHQRGRPDPAPAAHGAVLLAAARRAARHRRRRRVGPPHRDLRGGAHPLRRRAGHLRVDDGHLQGAPRRARRRGRARAAAGRGRRDRQGVPAHPRQGRPARHRRPARAAQPRPRQPADGRLLRPRRGPRRPAPAHRPAPVRRRAVQRRPARPHPGRGELDRASR